MKPLLTRASVRNVPTATLIAAFGCVLIGLPASSASARVVAVSQAPQAVSPRIMPGGPIRDRRPAAQADLTITARESPSSPARRWVLTCGPDGGSLPRPDRACEQLSRTWHPFAPLVRDTTCSMIAYGAQTATVTGYWHGTWISARFSRNNGCEAARWNKIAWVLGIPVSGAPVNPGGPMVSGTPAQKTS